MRVGQLLIVSGIVLVVVGVLFTLGMGRLPGDIVIRGKNTTFYFPIVTSILLSVILSFIFWLIRR